MNYITVGLLILNAIILTAIKFNDLKHMEKVINKLDGKVDNLFERINRIEGHLDIK